MLDKIHNLPTIIDIILIPDYSLMAFSSAIEPLRLANRLADRKLYDWRVVSVDGNSVVSSNGVEIVPSGGLNVIQKPKLIFVAIIPFVYRRSLGRFTKACPSTRRFGWAPLKKSQPFPQTRIDNPFSARNNTSPTTQIIVFLF